MSNPPAEFENLVVRHQAAVCAVAFSVLRDRARSEEIAQEAFLLAWQKLPRMHPAPSLPGWICGIARNLARNAARRRTETQMTGSMTDRLAGTDSPLDALLDRENADLAERALAVLSDGEREAVVLYYRNEESLPEVASALGISPEAAKKRVQRGRESLREAVSAVAASLRATRPGAAFTAGCVAAFCAHGKTAAAATSAKGGTPAKLGLVAGGLGLLLIAGTVAWRTHGSASPSLSSSDVMLAEAPHATPPAKASRPAAWTTLTRPIKPDARAPLLAKIASTRTARLAAAPPAPASASDALPPAPPGVRLMQYNFGGERLFGTDYVAPPPRAPGPLSLSDLRNAIHSVLPLIRECYTAAAPQLTRRDGTMTLGFRLEGEPDVGTLITAASLSGDPQFSSNAELARCVRESLLSIEMPGLQIPGVVVAVYQFVVLP